MPANRRPRTWEELRRRVLEDGYLSVADMEDRRRTTRLLQRVPWLIPIFAVGLLPTLLTEGDGVRWVLIVSLALLVYGALSAYWIGVRWERRWTELIREKSGVDGADSA